MPTCQFSLDSLAELSTERMSGPCHRPNSMHFQRATSSQSPDGTRPTTLFITKRSNTLDLTRSHHNQRPGSKDCVPRQEFKPRVHVHRAGTEHPSTRPLVPNEITIRKFRIVALLTDSFESNPDSETWRLFSKHQFWIWIPTPPRI
ncbi:hypothetical protein FF1_041564 [Malus domestica]